MVRSVVSKVMWVGRATVFLVGLAVILAVVFGMVSRATAHTGSAGLFHLNHNNPVTALSTLTGTLSGSVLKVDNNGTGTALFLETASGKPPLQVPSTAGKASNLNADKLDGREASSFANGVGGKATDADKLDGNDSSAFVKNTGTMTFSSFGPWKSLGTTAPGAGDPTAAIVDDGLPHVTQFTRPNTNPATSSVILVPDTVPSSLYGKSMNLTGVELCYNTSDPGIAIGSIALLEQHTINSPSIGGTPVFTASSPTDGVSCQKFTGTPQLMGTNSFPLLRVDVNWAIAGSSFSIGRATFFLEPSNTAAAPLE